MARLHGLSLTSAEIPAGSIVTADLADAAVTPVKESSGYRSIASDGALALAAADRIVLLAASASGTKAATMTATHAGHKVLVRLVAASGGAYTLAVTGGTITLDAANEGAIVVYDGAAWQLVALLGGATIA
jgi:hypothetical protein